MRNSRLPRRIEKGPAPSDSRYGSHAGLFVIVASPPNSVSAAGSRPSMGCTAATLRVGVAWRRGVLLGRPRARPGNHGCAALRPAGCGTPGRLAAFLIRRPSCVAATRVFRLSWPLRVSLSSSVKRRYVYAARAFLSSPRRPGSPPARGPARSRCGLGRCGVDNRSGTSEASRVRRRRAPAPGGD